MHNTPIPLELKYIVIIYILGLYYEFVYGVTFISVSRASPLWSIFYLLRH